MNPNMCTSVRLRKSTTNHTPLDAKLTREKSGVQGVKPDFDRTSSRASLFRTSLALKPQDDRRGSILVP